MGGAPGEAMLRIERRSGRQVTKYLQQYGKSTRCERVASDGLVKGAMVTKLGSEKE